MDGPIVLFGYAVPLSYLVVGLGLGGLICGYILGAFFSTRGVALDKVKKDATTEDPGVLKGINSLLANDTETAIRELSRVVERQSESVETYIALGHLFRTKGQFDRAVAIRQSIIARRGLPAPVRIQALFDMGVDYHQGGFLSRSIETLEQVLREDSRHRPALTELIQVFQEMGRWDEALESQRRLFKLLGKSDNSLLARFKTERGKQLAAESQADQAAAAFRKALSWDKGMVDALLSLGDLHLARGELKKALATWRKVGQAAPEMAFLALDRVAGLQWGAKDADLVTDFIVGLATESGDPRARLTAARHLAARGRAEETRKTLTAVLESSPCYLPAHRDLGQLLLERGNMDAILDGYRAAADCLPGPEPEYQCRRCGLIGSELYWQCPSCRAWDTFAPVEV